MCSVNLRIQRVCMYVVCSDVVFQERHLKGSLLFFVVEPPLSNARELSVSRALRLSLPFSFFLCHTRNVSGIFPFISPFPGFCISCHTRQLPTDDRARCSKNQKNQFHTPWPFFGSSLYGRWGATCSLTYRFNLLLRVMMMLSALLPLITAEGGRRGKKKKKSRV